MRLFAGLGNPGPAYAHHRHNVGFMAVDAIHAAHGFPAWRARFEGHASEGRLGSTRVMLLKPMTFMNESGRSVGQAVRYLKLEAGDVTVFHDELDLAPFQVRVKAGGGTAGHNGLKSVAAHIGPDFVRVRIGIGHPGHRDRVTPHVLGNWAKAEEGQLAALLDDIAALAPLLAEGDAVRFMNDLALRQGRAA